MLEAVPVPAPVAEVAAARVVGRVVARAAGLEPEAEAEAERVEPVGRLVEELAARAAPAPGEPAEPAEPGEQVVGRVELAAEPEERAEREEVTTTRTRMR